MYREEFWGYELPPPNILEAYNEIHPGYAARRLDEDIADRAYARQAHHRDQEGSHRALELNAQGFKRGQIFGLIVALVFGVLGFLSGQTGHDWLGAVFGGGTVVSLAAVFVINRLAPSKENSTSEIGPPSAPPSSPPALPPGPSTS